MSHTPGPYSYNWNSVSKEWRIIGLQGYGAIAHVPNEGNAVMICAALNASSSPSHLITALGKSVERIEQLCMLVNTLSNNLGLGRKVHVDDFADVGRAALSKARGQ